MTPEDLSKLHRAVMDAEGFRASAYQDSEGFWTIGFGRLIDARRGGKISRDEALMLLSNDLSAAVRECEHAFPWFADQVAARQRALVELDFNMGLSKLRTFTNTLSAWAGGRYERAADGLLASLWAKQAGLRRSNRIAAMVRTGLDA